MFVISMILFKIFLLKFNLAEWIDMPEFSDETKVYRISTPKQDHFHKFTKQTKEDQFLHAYQNVTYKDIQIEQTTNNDDIEHVFHKIKDTIIEPMIQTPSKKEENVQLDEAIPLIKEQKLKKEYFNESLISTNEEIFQYLPLDTLKSVHQTLKLQLTSSEGKIQFLKMFENTLIAEIESQLTQAIITGRQKRGVEHYDHGYDNDHAAGFPSIEGALMAISFLTFAVYLIRLVMLLFRNINNSMPTTTGATLLLGRRKRSMNKFDDDLIMIFKNIDNFSFRS
ncbi:uncharacterized protein LOC114875812 isoform X1 [Osmia bicornis bicornis]|uniref:uncharacterized protein LOC114875812 isoform X1 n=2 Tax=Osmia bicornis bicornis TaxID=1437191 RepID=UPI0010F4971B|nr:uncharacterized protein LOC114875812 isoform X1 [Osmia bicornis bicornis]